MASGRTFKIPSVMEGGRKDFDGPLDLLLFLIKKNEVNLYDIPIAEITDQYISYVTIATKLELDDMADFHLLASTLLYIKSKMLLPVEFDGEDEVEDPRAELVERLIEYQKFRKLSILMEEKGREAEWIIERKKLERTLPFESEGMWQKIEVWELLKTFNALMKNLSSEQIIDLYEEVSINEKLTLIEELVRDKGECSFEDIIVRHGSLMDIVCAFLAILEAMKLRMICVYQNTFFGDISIRAVVHHG
ncbi:MAG: segregation/condensation protein A [Spirochaetaceae bacterium]|jgi:segregation and condensation protein A|nr:segregation/condensation protein A [Spirochaetaceae bacterium]